MIAHIFNIIHCSAAVAKRAQMRPLILGALVAVLLASCASQQPASEVLVSIRDQKIALIKEGKPVKVYACSTSKFCVSDQPGSYGTPVGKMRVAQKIGQGAPMGAVFKGRRPTGEILRPDAPGRDPIVTRIMRLQGMQQQNARAYARNIYIHGTPEERTIGRPASYGCVRMRSADIAELFDMVPAGTAVNITKASLPGRVKTFARRQDKQGITPAAPVQVTPPAPSFQQGKSKQMVAKAKFGPEPAPLP